MRRMIPALLKAGLIAGTLDILLAFANAWWSSGVPPERVLQFVASGLIGGKAFGNSGSVALLGLAIHFFVAFFWTAVFFFFYPKFKNIVSPKLMQAILYGVFVWLVMNLIVLPATNTPKTGFQWFDAIKGMIILIIAIGSPLVYFAHGYYQGSVKYGRTKG